MEEEKTAAAKDKEQTSKLLDSIIHYLPLGYLYLLLLGIGKDSIYYGILGINIMSYSNVLDVLLSPLVQLTTSFLFPLVILVIIVVGAFYLKLILYVRSKKKNKSKNQGYFESLPFRQLWLYYTIFSIFCAFIGFGIGGGRMKQKKLESQELKIKNRLTFENKEVLDVAIIGNNTGFIFYALKGEQTIRISPIQNLQMIENLSD
jgi:hypothetical protein